MGLTVVVPGSFDFLHEGHCELLDYALSLNPTEVAVLVNGDKMLADRKEQHYTQEQRAQMVRDYLDTHYEGMSMVYIADTIQEWKETILTYAPCVVLHGNDWTKHGLSRIYGVDYEWWDENNIKLLYKDRMPDVSSTELRKQHVRA